ncbi:amidase [Shimia biformata]|uniref:amidase n=1 Tax=Shimia biformata TaxID=1294299 RepID=UPI001EF19E83|nr:amidase [Shimia biformata]
MPSQDLTNHYLSQDATSLAAELARGEFSAGELLDVALSLVAARNPDINAVVNIQKDTARRHIAGGLLEGPFKGVPFLLKDLGAEAVDFPTSAGSRLWAGSQHSYDSEVYLRLKAAGLVTFGRTTSPELGVGAVTEAQAYGGPTRNPWNIGRTSGGSSGGAGAAVAAGIVPVAHGSDGGGSVRIPAASCGLVGFKPTRARLPEGPGAGEGWAGMATDGFLTRSLRDTAALLDCINGPDLGAPYFPPPMEMTFAESARRDPEQLKIRFATTTLDGTPIHPDCVTAVERTAKLLADLGHDVEPVTLDPGLNISDLMLAWTRVVACGTALSVRQKLAGKPLDPSLIEGVTRGAIALSHTLSGADYLESVEEIHAFGRRIARWFQGFDILLTPTLARPPIEIGALKPDNEDFIDYRNGPTGVFAYSPYTALFNASGQPAVSLPLFHNSEDLPIGLHLAARFGADCQLMSLAGQLERAAPWAATQQRLVDRL